MKFRGARGMPDPGKTQLGRQSSRILGGVCWEKRVSVAWVIREAAERYVAERWCLFANGEERTL